MAPISLVRRDNNTEVPDIANSLGELESMACNVLTRNQRSIFRRDLAVLRDRLLKAAENQKEVADSLETAVMLLNTADRAHDASRQTCKRRVDELKQMFTLITSVYDRLQQLQLAMIRSDDELCERF